MIPRCLSSPVSDPIYCRICLYVAPLALLYALLKIPQGDLPFAELNIHVDMTVRFFVRQKNQRFDVAQDYKRSQKRPFSKGETIKNLGYDSQQYLLDILYSILPPLSILSKAFILQWVKGENIHEKKGGRRMLFPSVARAALPLYSDTFPLSACIPQQSVSL